MRKTAVSLAALIAVAITLIAAFPESAARLALDAERYANGLGDRTAVVAGETWHYLEGGPADAEVVLLLHGFGGDKDNWTRFAGALTDRYRVIVPDLPAFGESRHHDDWDYALPAQQNRVHAFAAALGLERYHLAGHSMGGHLAALYTHAHPAEVMSMALFNNAGIPSAPQSDLARALARGQNPLIVRTPAEFEALIEFSSWKRPFIPWPVNRVLARRAVARAPINEAVFADLLEDRGSNLEPLLSEISGPVLIVWGEHDRLLHVGSVDVMQALMPQAEAVVMKQTGHLPILERPGETAGCYLDFLTRLPDDGRRVEHRTVHANPLHGRSIGRLDSHRAAGTAADRAGHVFLQRYLAGNAEAFGKRGNGL